METFGCLPATPTSARKQSCDRTDDNGNAMLPKKKKNFKDTRLKISVPLAISTNIKKVSSKLSKKPGKKTPGQMFGQDRPEKNSAKRLIRSGEIPSPRQTSINKTNGFVMNSERGALIRGSDPPSGHSVHNTAGDAWRALARRLIQKHLITGA